MESQDRNLGPGAALTRVFIEGGTGSGGGLDQALQLLACPWRLSAIAHQRRGHIVPLVGAGVTWSSGMTLGPARVTSLQALALLASHSSV